MVDVINKVNPETLNKFVVMVGIVGAGKTTLAKDYEMFLKTSGRNVLYLSSDDIRVEIAGDVNDQTHNEEVFKELHHRIKVGIVDHDVIVDATNVSRKSRRALLNCVKKHECRKIAVVMTTPLETCHYQNQNRDRVVPSFVIEKQVRSFEIPFYEEGFDEIWFDRFPDEEFEGYHEGWNLAEDPIFKSMEGFDQRNSHHLYTLEDHCHRVALELIRPEWKRWNNKPMVRAATIHDVGKLYTGEPKEDGSGNWTYKGHMNYGTYTLLQQMDKLGFNNKKDILDCLFYVNYHMEPFFWLSTNKRTSEQFISEKTEKKMIEQMGREKYLNLRLFNLCDRIASGTDREGVEKDREEIKRLLHLFEHPEEAKRVKLSAQRGKQARQDSRSSKMRNRKIEITTGQAFRSAKTQRVSYRTDRTKPPKYVRMG